MEQSVYDSWTCLRMTTAGKYLEARNVANAAEGNQYEIFAEFFHLSIKLFREMKWLTGGKSK